MCPCCACGLLGPEAVLRELCWLPSVRLLWLGQRGLGGGGGGGEPPSEASVAAIDDEAEAKPEEAVEVAREAAEPLSALQKLTADVMRLIILAIVQSHAPSPSALADQHRGFQGEAV